MKNCLAALVAVVCGVFFLASCSNDDDVIGTTSFYGKVIVNPSSAKRNESVSFCIGDEVFTTGDVSVGVGSSASVNGKDIVKSISYFIDGDKVAESSDKDNKYAASYRIENLSVGSHVVTAKCSSNFKNYTIEEHIIQGELKVE